MREEFLAETSQNPGKGPCRKRTLMGRFHLRYEGPLRTHPYGKRFLRKDSPAPRSGFQGAPWESVFTRRVVCGKGFTGGTARLSDRKLMEVPPLREGSLAQGRATGSQTQNLERPVDSLASKRQRSSPSHPHGKDPLLPSRENLVPGTPYREAKGPCPSYIFDVVGQAPLYE